MQQVPEKETAKKIEDEGRSKEHKIKTYIIFTAVLAAAVILYFAVGSIGGIDLAGGFANLILLKGLPELGSDTGYGILLLFGALTSFHCVGMCGGIILSQTAGNTDGLSVQNSGRFRASWLPSASYNLGRLISYSVIGGIVGGFGYAIGFSGAWKGVVPIAGGLFMMIMGINLLGNFPVMRRLSIRMPNFFAKKLLRKNNYTPFYIGLLSGLMPCGPLQIVQLYALGTRSVVFGAVSMLIFALGTVPVLFAFGVLNSIINKQHTVKIMRVSAVLVIFLGVIMIGRGFALSGVNLHMPVLNSPHKGSVAKIEGGVQTVTTELQPGSYEPIVVQKDIPVKWMIKAGSENLNGCNNAITIPELQIEKTLEEGDNLIEFVPRKEGEIAFTCWMGMIKSKITVVEKIDN